MIKGVNLNKKAKITAGVIGSGLLALLLGMFSVTGMVWNSYEQTKLGHDVSVTSPAGDMGNVLIKRVIEGVGFDDIVAVQIRDVNVTILDKNNTHIIFTGVPANYSLTEATTEKIMGVKSDNSKVDLTTIEYKCQSEFNCGIFVNCMME
jgi:hypothetical protein